MTIDKPFLITSSELPQPVVARDFQRIHRGVYADPRVELAPIDAIRAAWLRAGPGAVVGGVSAATMYGVSFYRDAGRLELFRCPTGQGRELDRIKVVRTDLDPRDVLTLDGMPVTSPIRTAYDLGRRTPTWSALGYLDALVAATDLDRGQLWRFIVDHPRTRGIRQIRGLVPWIDPQAESFGESWMRHLVLAADLPRPETQVVIRGAFGRKIARFDHAYRAEKIAFEFDGFDYHYSEEQRESDAARDRATAELGWHTERRNSVQLRDDPLGFVTRIGRLRDERRPRRR
ncbi:hypothetical protein ACQ7HM_11575 [Williamsia sp. MIQD14]|uniref:hypothetical protein n=1 Tax=Williamsia sp. MIQD14 TaxID=3425703 RepID=UPI003DA0BDF5